MCRPKLSYYAGVVLAAGMVFAATQAAAQNPPNCNANLLGIDIAKNPGGNIKSGTVVTYTITVVNKTVSGANIGCNINLGTSGLVFHCPAADGTPTGTITTLIAGGSILPADDNVLTFNVPCTITVNPGVTSATALVDAPGAILDDGFNSQANINKAIGINVVTPCIAVTKNCVNPCTPYGDPIKFSGVVTNCGDIALQGVTVTDDHAGLVLGPISLAPHTSANYSGQYTPTGNLCGPFTDTVTAKGDANTQPTATSVTATASATCQVSTAPAITLTKDCNPKSVIVGETYTETFVVKNTGNVPLVNVVIHDTKKGVTTDINIFTAAGSSCNGATQLNPGQSCTVNIGPFTTTTADCPSVTDSATVTANNICPGTGNPDCQNPATANAGPVTCTVNVICVCTFTIQKDVACFLGAAAGCGAFADTATGVRDTTCPAFCYRFTIVNTGVVPLNLSSVVDDHLGDLTSRFGTIAVGGSKVVTISPTSDPTLAVDGKLVHCVDTLNTVTATCTNPDGSKGETHTDTAKVVVLQIDIDCVSLLLHSSEDLDGVSQGEINPDGSVDPADDSHVTLPNTTAPVTLTLTLKNIGTAQFNVTAFTGLPDGLVDCTVGGPVDIAALLATINPLAPGDSRTFVLGCVDVTCPGGATFSITARAEADDKAGTLCVFDSSGNRIFDVSDACPASVTCSNAVTCRVTGGGTLIDGTIDVSCVNVPTTISPLVVNGLTVNKITHGGQLGAPFSQMDCGAILGNPCIRGQWQHTRHYQGQGNPRDVIDMNFHSVTPKGQFDSLSCACLGCCDPETGAFIPPSEGPLIHKFAICNPDDHKICGPQPRPAPANAIIFSGVGKLTPASDNGVDASKSEWVVFRVYIEDRSEPGGFHPKGAVEPADIYCFQAWKTGIRTSKKPDFSTIAAAFRTALGQANCDFLAALEGGALPIGTLPSPEVNGLTADIQDCGPLHDGNQQIHPSTGATCDQ